MALCDSDAASYNSKKKFGASSSCVVRTEEMLRRVRVVDMAH